MAIEVEQKFPVEDLGSLIARLAQHGVTVSGAQTEVDTYFRHPSRDLSATDEALRIRRKGRHAFATYKGPKIDPTTKTRREIDLPLARGIEDADAWQELFEALGFAPVTEVRKRRRKAMVEWQNRQVEVSLDEVDEVGTFVELELVTELHDLESAKACIQDLAAELGLRGSERRSYLELLLERRG